MPPLLITSRTCAKIPSSYKRHSNTKNITFTVSDSTSESHQGPNPSTSYTNVNRNAQPNITKESLIKLLTEIIANIFISTDVKDTILLTLTAMLNVIQNEQLIKYNKMKLPKALVKNLPN